MGETPAPGSPAPGSPAPGSPPSASRAPGRPNDGWPAPGWTVHEVEPTITIRVTHEMPPLSAALDAAVEQYWAAAQVRANGALFNGRVFCAETITPALVTGHWTEYRRLVAQFTRPALFADLALRPMAVGGALVCADGVVIGRRPENAVYQAGMWQLPPAGNLDADAAEPDGEVAFARQLLVELAEELGLGPLDVRIVRPLAIVEHAETHVCDLGIALATDLDAHAVARAHARARDKEYDPLRVIPFAELAAFVAWIGPKLTPQALVFLAAIGLLPGESSGP